ncbi:MAG: inositol monophosphatase, partial [Betaproteobacteria bacterium]
MRLPLAEVIAIVEAEGARLRAEFYLPRGPRGERGSAPIDREIEERLRAKLQALVPCTFCGEECETVTGAQEGWIW